MRRVFPGTTRGPSGILGLVILLLPAMSVARRLSPGVGSPRIRRPASVAASPGGFQTKAVDEPFRRDSGAVDEPRRSDEPRLRCDLAKLLTIATRAFDLVIANVVLQDVRRLDAAFRELHRVLRSDGRLIFSITHPAFDIPPARWVREPQDTDRPEERPFIAVDRYFDRVALYWGPSGQPELVGFHRPLRDFTEGLRQAGFAIARLEEPRPLPEAIKRRYRQFADQLRVPNFLIIEARKA